MDSRYVPILLGSMATILLVEDHDDVRRMLCLYLERAGYHLQAVPDGEAALEHYREDPADLVVTDLLLPGMSGVELIADLRCEFPDVKIVATSSGEKMLARARQMAVTEILQKPFPPSKLLKIIKRILGRSCS